MTLILIIMESLNFPDYGSEDALHLIWRDLMPGCIEREIKEEKESHKSRGSYERDEALKRRVGHKKFREIQAKRYKKRTRRKIRERRIERDKRSNTHKLRYRVQSLAERWWLKAKLFWALQDDYLECANDEFAHPVEVDPEFNEDSFNDQVRISPRFIVSTCYRGASTVKRRFTQPIDELSERARYTWESYWSSDERYRKPFVDVIELFDEFVAKNPEVNTWLRSIKNLSCRTLGFFHSCLLNLFGMVNFFDCIPYYSRDIIKREDPGFKERLFKNIYKFVDWYVVRVFNGDIPNAEEVDNYVTRIAALVISPSLKISLPLRDVMMGENRNACHHTLSFVEKIWPAIGAEVYTSDGKIFKDPSLEAMDDCDNYVAGNCMVYHRDMQEIVRILRDHYPRNEADYWIQKIIDDLSKPGTRWVFLKDQRGDEYKLCGFCKIDGESIGGLYLAKHLRGSALGRALNNLTFVTSGAKMARGTCNINTGVAERHMAEGFWGVGIRRMSQEIEGMSDLLVGELDPNRPKSKVDSFSRADVIELASQGAVLEDGNLRFLVVDSTDQEAFFTTLNPLFDEGFYLTTIFYARGDEGLDLTQTYIVMENFEELAPSGSDFGENVYQLFPYVSSFDEDDFDIARAA